jgi:hypothetical protein
MKKLLAATLLLGLVITPAVSQAKKSRTDSGEYNTLIISPDTEEPSASGEFHNGVVFTPRRGERFIGIVLEDKMGMTARAVLTQDFDGDGQDDFAREICGATASPIKFRPGIDIEVSAQDGPCTDGTNALATFGTIKATFTR